MLCERDAQNRIYTPTHIHLLYTRTHTRSRNFRFASLSLPPGPHHQQQHTQSTTADDVDAHSVYMKGCI